MVIHELKLSQDHCRSKQDCGHGERFPIYGIASRIGSIAVPGSARSIGGAVGIQRLFVCRSVEPDAGIVNRTVEIGTQSGNALGDACQGELDPGNSVKVYPESCLAFQAIAWCAFGRILIQLWCSKALDVDKEKGQ